MQSLNQRAAIRTDKIRINDQNPDLPLKTYACEVRKISRKTMDAIFSVLEDLKKCQKHSNLLSDFPGIRDNHVLSLYQGLLPYL